MSCSSPVVLSTITTFTDVEALSLLSYWGCDQVVHSIENTSIISSMHVFEIIVPIFSDEVTHST